MDFLKQDNPRVRSGRYFIPGRKFVLPVDTTSLFSNVEMNEEQKANLQSDLRFEINRRGLPKNNLMTLDLINQVSQNGWERPVYFAVTASKENYLGLDNYLHREGLAYRLLPYTGKGNDLFGGNVNTEKMYENMMTKFKWGNIQDPDVYLDENNLRMITNLRYTFATLANALTDEGKNDSARVILDKCMELMPNQNAPYDAAIIPVIQVYYNIDETEKAIEISREYATMLHQEISFFDDLKRDKPQKFRLSERDYSFAQRNLFSLFSFASSFGQEEFANELMKLIEEHGMGGIPPMPNM